ncbi:MAG: hypothetical protein ACI33P_04945 [Lysinibacillus sp.]
MLYIGAGYFFIIITMLFTGYFHVTAFLLLSVACSLLLRRVPKEKDTKVTASAGFLFILAAIATVVVVNKDGFF